MEAAIPRMLRPLAALLLCLVGAGLCSAQTVPAPPARAGFTFTANVGEVLVETDVLDKKGREVNSLPASDFTVYENGVRQTVESFSHDDAPVSVGILVDNSGSMQPKVVQVDRAALNFVRTSNPKDEVFIVKFNDEYRMVTPFTSSIPAMEAALGSIEPESSTALYDAIINADAYMRKHARNAKKVLLVITDGVDDASSHDLGHTMRLLQSQDAPLIYTIGLVDNGDSRSSRKEGHNVLVEIADATGGMAYFPKNLNQVDAITRMVAQDIRLQYSLVYRSNQTAPGFRAIRVEVRDPHLKHLSAHTRKGYIAPAG